MKQLIAAFLLLASALPASAQSVKLPAEVRGNIGEFIQVKADTADAYVSWLAMDNGLNLFPVQLLKDTKTAVVVSTIAGRYRLSCVTARNDKPSEFASTVVIVGNTPPVPPGPGPTPEPPGPNPPGPAPTPDVGFRALIVFDKTKVDLPPPQDNIIKGKEVRDYLNSKCAKNDVTGVKEWAIWPDGDNVDSYPSPALVKAYKRPRTSLPWLVISTGSSGYEGPLPANVGDMLTLLRKYGG